MDELFWTHEDSIEPHFHWLEEYWGALQMTYANHEGKRGSKTAAACFMYEPQSYLIPRFEFAITGVPERGRSTPEWVSSEMCGDPFIDTTLFRRFVCV